MAESSTQKRKRTRSTSKDSVLHGRYFSTAPQHHNFLKHFAQRSIIEPKFLDIAFLDAEDFEICDLLGHAHILQLAIMKDEYVDDMVRAFYSTMSYSNDILKAEVKGKTFTVPPNEWPSLIGHAFEGRSIDEEFPEFNKNEFAQSIVEPGLIVTKSKFSVGMLTMNNRILHYVVTHILSPRPHNYSVVYDYDLFLMWILRSGVDFNWPSYICSHMLKAKSSGALPYAPLVYRIMRFQQVDDDGEFMKEDLHPFGEHLLSQMQIKKIDNVWRRVTDPPPAAGAAAPGDLPEDAPVPHQAHAAASSSQPDTSSAADHSLASILTALHTLTTSVDTMNSNMQSGFTSVHTRQAAIERRLEHIEDHLHIPPMSPPSPDSADM